MSDWIYHGITRLREINEPQLAAKAAYEVEALRQRVAELERDGEHYDCNVAILTQQRDAAEAALRKIADHAIESPSQAAYWARSYFAAGSATPRETVND